NNILKLDLCRMKLGEPNAKGDRDILPIPGSTNTLSVDTVISSLGQMAVNGTMTGGELEEQLKMKPGGMFFANPRSSETSVPGVFAGGDAATGTKSVIQAVVSARRAANNINAFVMSCDKDPADNRFNFTRGKSFDDVSLKNFDGIGVNLREKMPTRPPEVSTQDYDEVKLGFTEKMARREAERCLKCGCTAFERCDLKRLDIEMKVNINKTGMGKEPIYPLDMSHRAITVDPNKCVFCGRCERSCEYDALEVRADSFDEHERPVGLVIDFKENCVSCGKCVENCSTGALNKRNRIVPIQGEDVREIKTTCPYCGTGCNFYLLSDENGRLTGVEPAGNHPTSRGQLCVKGWNAHAFVDHPDRLQVPLIRNNGELQPADWQTALDLVDSKLSSIAGKYGPDSLMFLSSAKASNEENYLLMKLARAGYGTNNIDHCARLCHSSTVTGLMETLGSGAMTNGLSCFEETELIFVIGSNTTEQHPLIGSRILQAVQRGAELIVADSRRIRLSRHADLHLRHQNGSDVALLNGMMRQILQDRLEDRAFIAERTENFAALQQSLELFTPEYVAKSTGLLSDQIVSAARLFAKADRAMIVYAMGITQHSHGVDNVRAVSNLALLTGNLGRPGSGINPLRGQNNVQGACDMGALPDVYSGYQKVAEPAVRQKFSSAWGVPLPERPGLMSTHAIEAAAAGKVRGMLILGENPMLSDANQQLVKTALGQLEFLAVIAIFPTETTQLSDVVLPAACYAERDGTFTSTERRIQLGRKAVEPPGEARADWQILCELLQRHGLKSD
ncbi:MAG: molybdopterin-dependent oxidoreductase, partial [Geopsychrobacter sp.]|nr:molybdopterin-dependent oxidoreductase [Geopsychrobacter sp.]